LNKKLLGISRSIALALMIGTGYAQAGLIGTTVTASYFHPDLSTSIASQNFLVGPGIELVCGSSGLCLAFDSHPESLDFTDTQIIFNQGPFNSGNYDNAPYNGFVFTNLNMGSPIKGFLLSSTGFSGLTNSAVSFTANSLNVNLSGVGFANSAGFTITLLTSTVPEPSTAALFFAALAGVAVAFYWRREHSARWRHIDPTLATRRSTL
jgi:hypothetical protein